MNTPARETRKQEAGNAGLRGQPRIIISHTRLFYIPMYFLCSVICLQTTQHINSPLETANV